MEDTEVDGYSRSISRGICRLDGYGEKEREGDREDADGYGDGERAMEEREGDRKLALEERGETCCL